MRRSTRAIEQLRELLSATTVGEVAGRAMGDPQGTG